MPFWTLGVQGAERLVWHSTPSVEREQKARHFGGLFYRTLMSTGKSGIIRRLCKR